MISNKEMDQTETETKLTQLQLRQALDNQKLAQLELARAQEIVDRHAIRSPITGVIMERFKTLGEYVDDQPIVRVAQLSPLFVEVIIPVEQLGKVKMGMLAKVRAGAIDQTWQAEVSRIDRVADVASGTYGVRLTLENPDYKIPAGLRCRVTFPPVEKAVEKATPFNEQPETTMPVTPAQQTAATDLETNSTVNEQPQTIIPVTPAQQTAATELQTDSTVNEQPETTMPVTPAQQTAATDLETNSTINDQPQSATSVTLAQQTAATELETNSTVIEQPETTIPVTPAQQTAATDVETEPNMAATQQNNDISLTEISQCGWLGPYPNQHTAQLKAAELQVSGVHSSVQKKTENVRTGTSVLSPAFATKQQVDAYLQRLREAGDKDFYQLPHTANQPYYVSLGFHSQINSTERRLKQLQSKGFSVTTQPRYRAKERYWLLVNGNFSLLDTTIREALAEASEQTETMSCTPQAPLNNTIASL